MLVSVQTSFVSQYIAHLEMSRLPLRGKGRVSHVHVNHGDWVVLSVTLNSTDFINFLSASFTPKRGVLSHLLVFPAMPDIFFVFYSVCFVVSPQSPVFLKAVYPEPAGSVLLWVAIELCIWSIVTFFKY